MSAELMRYHEPPPDPTERVQLLVWDDSIGHWLDAGTHPRIYAEALMDCYSIKWPPNARFRIVG